MSGFLITYILTRLFLVSEHLVAIDGLELGLPFLNGGLGELLALTQFLHGACTLEFLLVLLERFLNRLTFFNWNNKHMSILLWGRKSRNPFQNGPTISKFLVK